MADQFDNNTRSPHPDADFDDPLAELARIIGYERPPESAPKADESPASSEFDLEAELMRELDVPLAPSVDEIDRIEADEAMDVMLADADFERDDQQALTDPGQNEFYDLQAEASDESVPGLGNADFVSVEGRSSDALLRTIETEFPIDPDAGQAPDEMVVDDGDWALPVEPEEFASDPVPDDQVSADEEQVFEQVAEEPVAAAPWIPQAADAVDPSGDDVLADMVRFELPSTVASAVSDDSNVSDIVAEAQVDGESDESTLDFEEYLSTELDVFEHEVALGGSDHEIVEPEPTQSADNTSVYGDDSEFNVETALDALNDSALDDDVAVFDDAAEELLAAINSDVSPVSSVRPASVGSIETADDWSLDSIEEATADELDDELGDMFGLPERVVEPDSAKADISDDFELDLEQVLADSFDGSDDDWAEPLETAEPDDEPVLVADDWLSDASATEQSIHRDEMTEAFLGFVPHDEAQASQPELVSRRAGDTPPLEVPQGEPEHGDWLDGFETSEHVVESGESDYYFDADLIAEADETVEMVTDIDVPEIAHDEPLSFEPDYDTEIEREFAGIADRNDTNSDDRLADSAGATFASAEGWSLDATSSRGDEVSDDYIALERELGVGADQASGPSVLAGYDGDGPADDLVFHEEAALGYSGAGNGSRGPVVAVAVLGLALLAGLGAFGWSMFSADETTADGGPRIIRADKDPVKVLPENPGGVTVPNQDKAVYDRVAGGTGAATGQPALVNSAEEPVDVVQRTLDPEILPLEGRSDFTDKSEDRLSADGTASEAAINEAAVPVVSPRKVRTMIVKPDGSIVAREVVEPEVSNPAQEPQVLASAALEAAPSADPLQTLESASQPVAEIAAPLLEQPAEAQTAGTEGTVAPVRIVKTQPIRPVANAPVPAGRPADQPVNVVGTVNQAGRVGAAPAAPATPAATAPQPVEVASAPAAAAPAANPGGYYMQIASQPTAEGAQSSWNTLSNRYSSVLGGQSVDIQRADIEGKGVYHRVRVPAGSKDQANALCSRYKAAGGSCFVSR